MTTSELISGGGGDAQAIIDAATRASEPCALDLKDRLHAVIVPADGELKVIDTEEYLDRFRDRPRRKTGVYSVHDADSFVTFLEKHGEPETEVWADTTRNRLLAVINAHRPAEQDLSAEFADAGWGDFKVSYAVQLTQAWQAWLAHDGELLDQGTFAEHIEDRSIDIQSPDPADMLELAQTFQASIGVNFESSKRISSGETVLEYRETVDAKAGKSGKLEIPKEFYLGLIPFEGASAYKVKARFRYRITNGQLRIGYSLERPEDVIREAFLDVVTEVSGRISAPVLRGSTA